MDLIVEHSFNFTGLETINVLLGKNGSGKSTLLKSIEENLNRQNIRGDLGDVNYVTPERGGILFFNSGIEQSEANDPNFARASKRHNQWNDFKSYSVSQYIKLELITLREIETDHTLRENLTYTFDSVIEKINRLLTNIKIRRSRKGDFEIVASEGNAITPYDISSGESELISLAIECLTFEKSCVLGRNNWLLLDEPDVHLHPDLQADFILFLRDLVSAGRFRVIIATHSTAILGALLDYANARFAILKNRTISATFKPISEMYKNILPIFGAHPLSNLFNQSPIFLVDGEDDVRVFQKAVRTANGSLKIYPCSVDGEGNMANYENAVIEIINGVYDNGKAYSLRDRDNGDEDINDIQQLIRFKTSCREIENLILCDETLERLNSTWEELRTSIETWLESFQDHPKYVIMNRFREEGYKRKFFDIKDIRNLIVGLTPTTKDWEIAVGETIGRLCLRSINKNFADNKLCNYLGTKLSNYLCPNL